MEAEYWLSWNELRPSAFLSVFRNNFYTEQNNLLGETQRTKTDLQNETKQIAEKLSRFAMKSSCLNFKARTFSTTNNN